MSVAVAVRGELYSKNLLKARQHFNERHFSSKRIARVAAFVFLAGCLVSFTPGPQLILILPLLLEWSRVASTRRNEDPHQYLEALAKSSAEVEPGQVVKDLRASGSRGDKELAEQFLLYVRQGEDYVSSSRSEHFLNFSRFSPKRVAANAAALAALIHYTPIDDVFDVTFSSHPFTMIAGTVALYLGITVGVELKRSLQMRKVEVI